MFYDRKSWLESAAERLGVPRSHSWYLAQLKPNSLAIARRNLERQNFPVFVPQRVETRRAGARFRTGPFPLFPGYLFVALDPDEPGWRAINSTVGVTRLVAFGAKPAAVPPGLVEQLALSCDGEDVLLPLQPLQPGETVRLTEGPFAGLIAEVESTDADRRVWVLIEAMGQCAKLKVERSAIARSS